MGTPLGKAAVCRTDNWHITCEVNRNLAVIDVAVTILIPRQSVLAAYPGGKHECAPEHDVHTVAP